MAFTSGIQWTEATWNPWHGCIKVSPGCKYCYMYRGKEQYKQDPTIVQRSKTRFNDPLKWKEPRLIFPCSWSDFFIEQADAWRPEAWRIIQATPHHTYQMLTKRVERIERNLPLYKTGWRQGLPYIPRNVLMGLSAENDDEFQSRAPVLENVVRFNYSRWWISAEPLLGPMQNLWWWLDDDDGLVAPSWVVVGGESGNDNGKYKYRECKLEWIEDIVEQCKNHGVPVFVKQVGTHLAKKLGLKDRAGGNMEEWPEHLRVRQMFEGYQKIH
jgi:protein gp37